MSTEAIKQAPKFEQLSPVDQARTLFTSEKIAEMQTAFEQKLESSNDLHDVTVVVPKSPQNESIKTVQYRSQFIKEKDGTYKPIDRFAEKMINVVRDMKDPNEELNPDQMNMFAYRVLHKLRNFIGLRDEDLETMDEQAVRDKLKELSPIMTYANEIVAPIILERLHIAPKEDKSDIETFLDEYADEPDFASHICSDMVGSMMQELYIDKLKVGDSFEASLPTTGNVDADKTITNLTEKNASLQAELEKIKQEWQRKFELDEGITVEVRGQKDALEKQVEKLTRERDELKTRLEEKDQEWYQSDEGINANILEENAQLKQRLQRYERLEELNQVEIELQETREAYYNGLETGEQESDITERAWRYDTAQKNKWSVWRDNNPKAFEVLHDYDFLAEFAKYPNDTHRKLLEPLDRTFLLTSPEARDKFKAPFIEEARNFIVGLSLYKKQLEDLSTGNAQDELMKEKIHAHINKLDQFYDQSMGMIEIITDGKIADDNTLLGLTYKKANIDFGPVRVENTLLIPTNELDKCRIIQVLTPGIYPSDKLKARKKASEQFFVQDAFVECEVPEDANEDLYTLQKT